MKGLCIALGGWNQKAPIMAKNKLNSSLFTRFLARSIGCAKVIILPKTAQLLFIVTLLNISSQGKCNDNLCGLNAKSKKLAKLIINNSGQQHVTLTCDETLAKAALAKAKKLALKNKINHNINHTTPNEFLKQYGIDLPFHYQVLGNQVESILGGLKTADDAFETLMASEHHKAHLLGETDFLRKQSHIGVGAFHDDTTRNEYFWVVYITNYRQDFPDEKITNIKFNPKLVFIEEEDKSKNRRRSKKNKRSANDHFDSTRNGSFRRN